MGYWPVLLAFAVDAAGEACRRRVDAAVVEVLMYVVVEPVVMSLTKPLSTSL